MENDISGLFSILDWIDLLYEGENLALLYVQESK